MRQKKKKKIKNYRRLLEKKHPNVSKNNAVNVFVREKYKKFVKYFFQIEIAPTFCVQSSFGENQFVLPRRQKQKSAVIPTLENMLFYGYGSLQHSRVSSERGKNPAVFNKYDRRISDVCRVLWIILFWNEIDNILS